MEEAGVIIVATSAAEMVEVTLATQVVMTVVMKEKVELKVQAEQPEFMAAPLMMMGQPVLLVWAVQQALTLAAVAAVVDITAAEEDLGVAAEEAAVILLTPRVRM